MLTIGLEVMPKHIEGFTVIGSKGFIVILNDSLSLEKKVEILNKEMENMNDTET